MKSKYYIQGLSIIEVMLAVRIFSLLARGGAATAVATLTVNRRGEEETQATLLAQEGIEAARSIKNKSWASLATGAHGLTISGNQWAFNGTTETLGRFTRTVNVTAVSRDVSGNIVASGGAVDPDTMKVTSLATWEFYTGKKESVSLI